MPEVCLSVKNEVTQEHYFNKNSKDIKGQQKRQNYSGVEKILLLH